MPLDRPSLSELESSVFNSFTSRFAPLDKTPRYSLLKALCLTDAGIYHQLYGDIDFLSRQIFPDTAEADYLRAHWSDRVPPAYAIAARGHVVCTGTNGVSIPQGMMLISASGVVYYVEAAGTITRGSVQVTVVAQEPGEAGNLKGASTGAQPVILTARSTVPPGCAATATVTVEGISGGSDAESDEAYLGRVLQAIRTGHLYGKSGDWSAWAINAAQGVAKAWEFTNYNIFGTVLIQVIAGSHTEGVAQVASATRAAIERYIATVAPPVPYSVQTPELIALDPHIALPASLDVQANREASVSRLKGYLDVNARPGMTLNSQRVRDAIIDSAVITDATVSIGAASRVTSIYQLFVLGTVTWGE